MDESFKQNDEFLDSLIDDDLDLEGDREEEVEKEIDAHINEFSEYKMPDPEQFEEHDVCDSEVAPVLTSPLSPAASPTNINEEEEDQESEATRPHYATIRDSLKKFYYARVHTQKTWRLAGRFPGNNKDVGLDKLIKDLEIQRSYASNQWRLFKDNNGAPKPLRYDPDLERVVTQLLERIKSYGLENIFKNAVSKVSATITPSQKSYWTSWWNFCPTRLCVSRL
jgi:hypothetical protein